MADESKARRVNGVVSAILAVFFGVHALLGSIAAITGLASAFAFVVWLGLGLVGVHVVVSIVTSREQMNDREHPPSARKKRHLMLKWITGGLLAATATAHIVSMRMWGSQAMQSSALGAIFTVMLAIALAAHLCFGSKSLLTDLGVNRRYKHAFRAVVCILTAFFCIAAIAGAIL